jgi:predicted membrane channel-forming protein YqfA (hemolysin III family)
MVVFLSSAVICLMSSALFHLFYPMSSSNFPMT